MNEKLNASFILKKVPFLSAMFCRKSSALYSAGLKKLANGELHGAELMWKEAVAIDPKCTQARLALGGLYLTIGDIDQAIASLETVTKTAPTICEAWSNLGAAYRHAGRIEDSLNAHLEAVRLRPDDLISLVNAGVAQVSAGYEGRAEEFFLRALEIDPMHPMANLSVGSILVRKGAASDGIEFLTRAASDLDYAGLAFTEIAVAYCALSRITEAFDALKAVYDRDPLHLEEAKIRGELAPLLELAECREWLEKIGQGENTMYVSNVDAIAGTDTHKVSAGHRHAIVVMSRASNSENARMAAVRYLEDCGWKKISVHHTARVDPSAVEEMDEPTRQGFAFAREVGCHSFVFQEPLG